MSEKVTADGVLGYDENNSILSYERYYINPRLNIYVKGNKRHGIYLRTSYENQYSKVSISEDFDQQQTSSLGLFYNKYNFFVGGSIGSQIANINDVETSSNVLGVSSGISRDKVSYAANYSRSYNEIAYSDTISGSISYRPYNYLSMRGRVSYKNQENFTSSIMASDTNFFLSLTYLFGVGNQPVSRMIYEKSSSLEGLVFLDKNLNGKRDDGEPGLSGIKVEVAKQGQSTAITDSNGKFEFESFSQGNIYNFDIAKEGYGISSSNSRKMTNYSEEIEIGMFEKETKSIYFTGSSVPLIDITINSSCPGISYSPRTLMLTTHFDIELPKGISCEIIPDFSRAGGAYVANLESQTDQKLTFNVTTAAKFLNFTLDGKKKEISFNIFGKNQKISQGEEVSVIIEYFNGSRNIILPKGCEISPKIEKNTFQEIKNDIFHKITCF